MANVYALIKQTTFGTPVVSNCRQAYLDGLALFWRGQPDRVIDFSSKQLLAGVAGDEELAFYRLWLEQLACQKEYAGLRELVTHFYHMGRQAGAHRKAWLALRALAHLELDDWEACELFAPTLLASDDEPYSLEFSWRYQLRCWDGSSQQTVTFAASKVPLKDFFHWQALAQALLINGQDAELAAVLTHTQQLFPASPLADFFGAHRSLEKGQYQQAVKHSRRLSQTYPRSLDYHVLDAYSALLAKQTDAAILALQQALSLPGGVDDADVWTLLAASYQQRSVAEADQAAAQRVHTSARKALALRRRHGLPTDDLLTRYFDEKGAAHPARELGGNLDWQRAGGPLQQWLVKLSPRRAHELALANDEQVTILVQALGRQVRSDDLVFYAYPVADEGLRILALYAVAVDPQRDAQLGQVVVLKLLKKFSEPLIVKLESSDLVLASSKGRRQGQAAGCYHLGEDSFNVISASVHSLAEEGEEWRLAMNVARSS